MKPNAFRLILHDGSLVHLCGLSHHDSAKWVSDLRAEIENAQLKEEQEFEVLSGLHTSQLAVYNTHNHKHF